MSRRRVTRASASLLRRNGEHVIVLRVEDPGTPTPKGRLYPSVSHFEFAPTEAELLLYELHAIVNTMRGIKKKKPWWRFW